MTPGDRHLECDRLAGTLRGLRARTGLSLAGLADKTQYSKSSWERYLNGKTVPPRQAVEALCALAGEDPGRPLALWELAEAVWSGRAGRPPRPAPPTARAELPVPRPASPPDPAEAGPMKSGTAQPLGDHTAGPAEDGAAAPSASLGAASEATGHAARRLPHPRVHRELVVGGLCGLAAVAVAAALVAAGAFGAGHWQRGGSPATSALTVPASPGCEGGGCTGKNPESYGCDVTPPPTTLRQQAFPGRTVVKIRHGAACHAVWARIDLGEVGDRVEIRMPGHAPLSAEVKDEYDAKGSLSTPMIALGRAGPDGVSACLVREKERRCFGLRDAGPPG
ncbi:helix-turn-helix domain-containing protein [Streptomyces sp. NPDC001292]|uniref:helix-turn-helix domain-containing protein n=1 Tax=Streptomyces sp. NPDC001292 TaxID=3364558 RepID=UPI0036C07113